MNSYLRPTLPFLLCLLLFTLPEPAVLRELLLVGLAGAVAMLIPAQLLVTDKSYTDPHPALSYGIIGLGGALLTGIFWFRATSGSFGIETRVAVRIAKAVLFWMPAALFAMLYRSAGEGWMPGTRRTILTRLLVAVVGSLVGLAAHEVARTQIDPVPLGEALIPVERQLPDGDHRVEFRHEQSILHLDVTLDPSFTEPNIHSLQRLQTMAAHAARLTRRRDTDSLNLRIRRRDTELAALRWPDPLTDRPAERLRINFNGTGLSSLPAPGDLDVLFTTVQAVFRPKNLEASLEEATLVLRWAGNPEYSTAIPKKASEIPDIVYDWRAANRIALRAAALFDGLESIHLHMPGDTVSVPADSVDAGFHFQRLLPVPDVSVRVQVFTREEMPELRQTAGGAPVTIVWGDGAFDTRRKRAGPLWPWEKTALSGHQFYITGLEADRTVHLVMHPSGYPEEARWIRLQPGEGQQVHAVYLRNME
ncbi:MAG: hypothetical protein GVY15_09575 [Bacteroidetes bacterium]|jgi:hypothetical protein|nr:hypothetical protein [Bacteroidota bacterium]